MTAGRLRIVGIVTIAAMAAVTAIILFSNRTAIVSSYPVVATFSDAAGMTAGSPVVVAGVKVGDVHAVTLNEDRTVAFELGIDRGIELPADVDAAIVVQSLLGTKAVEIQVPDDSTWESSLEDTGVIPMLHEDGSMRTTTTLELVDLQDRGTRVLQELDADGIDELLGSLSQVLDGAHDDVEATALGVTSLLAAVNDRSAQVERLLASADTVSTTLANRDEQLLDALDDLAVVARALDSERGRLVDLLAAARATAESVGGLVADNRDSLDELFDDLDAVLGVIDQHQEEVVLSVAYLEQAVRGFASIATDGEGNANPNWINAFITGAVGAKSGGFEACGIVDRALDVILGPDPVPCADRDAPEDFGGTSAGADTAHAPVGRLLSPHLAGGAR